VVGLPTLAEVVQDQTRLADLPFTALWGLLRELGQIEREITTTMVGAAGRAESSHAPPPDRLLTLTECAGRLRVKIGTARLWFQKPPWDATVIERSKTRVLVSEARFDALLRDGLHAPPHRPALGAGRHAGPRIGRPHPVGPGGGAR
jgi:hypothetical protein